MSSKTNLSTAMSRTSEWICSEDIPSDVTVFVGGTSFSLHKFPLGSKCGYLKKLLSESSDADLTTIELSDVPGGAEAFELAAKFCYGINFEMNTENIAMLRCVAEYLEMTEDYAVGNLVGRTESYLTEMALTSLAGAISVLHRSEDMLPVAETAKLVSRCVDTIAYMACKNTQFESSFSSSVVDWWAEDLTVLRIDLFHRVVVGMVARGFKQYGLGPILMLYAQKSLRGLELLGKGRQKINVKQEHEKRVVLETIVGLLPREKNAISVSFLSMLLRAAIYLDSTVACRLDLERRIGLQLGQAALDDLLIPTFSFTGDTLFDVDAMQRIMINYLEHEAEGRNLGCGFDEEFLSPPQSDMERVGRLMESYLAEIASDRNLSVSKFIGIAEITPEQSRFTEDGMYRAIDIYLKAHPTLSDLEKKKVCGVMDCQKLSREACAHAAQNDRLPVQTVVQVLYFEQQRLRDVMSGSNFTGGGESPALPPKMNFYSLDAQPVSDEISSLRRENQELKFELLKLKMRLNEIEKPTGNSAPRHHPGNMGFSANKPPLPRKSVVGLVSKKLGKLSPFVRANGTSPAKSRTKPSKDRRHSIS